MTEYTYESKEANLILLLCFHVFRALSSIIRNRLHSSLLLGLLLNGLGGGVAFVLVTVLTRGSATRSVTVARAVAVIRIVRVAVTVAMAIAATAVRMGS